MAARSRLPLSLPRLDAARRKRLRARILAWYRREKRDLPWRRERDAWAILVSEAMLQQTRVETVLSYYDRFLQRFPTPADLAAASEEEVLEAWSGLGYYRRARALRAAAQQMVAASSGEVPSEPEALRALPGIGRYTAGAVLSIAFDQSEPIVDGNVERVFARLFALEDPAGSSVLGKQCWELARRLLPERGSGEWNQALMELGAICCTARAPLCTSCPLSRSCRARRAGRQEKLPRPKARAQTIEVELEILCAQRSGAWLLERRPPSGRMAGMWQFPTRERASEPGSTRLFPARLSSPSPKPERGAAVLAELRHSITRHRIRARLLSARAPSELPDPPYRWVAPAKIDGLALTGMARKAWRILSAEG